MRKLLLTTAIAIAMGSTAAFAHHPAEEFVDPDIYAMIDENVSDAHLALDFSDMGSVDVMGGDTDVGGDNSVGGTAVSLDADVGNAGAETGDAVEDVGAELAGDADIGAEMEAREEMNASAATEPSGPGAQR